MKIKLNYLLTRLKSSSLIESYSILPKEVSYIDVIYLLKDIDVEMGAVQLTVRSLI